MSFVNLPTGIASASKAVISFWFRVPADVLAQTTAEFNAWNAAGGDRPRLVGIVPLIVFGPPVQEKGSDFVPVEVGTYPQSASWHWSDGFGLPDCVGAQWVMNTGTYQAAHPFVQSRYNLNDTRINLDPSYIGIDCSGDYPAFTVHIVLPNSPTTVTGIWSAQTGYTNTANGVPQYFGGGVCPGAPVSYPGPPGFGFQMYTVTNPPSGYTSIWTETNIYDGSGDNLRTAKPEVFRLLPWSRIGESSPGFDAVDQNYNGCRVTSDTWHHVLLSFDFTDNCSTSGGYVTKVRHTDPTTRNEVIDSSSGEEVTADTVGARTSSTCKMWVAFDNENLTAKNLSCYWPDGYPDPNAILTVNGYAVACDTTFHITDRSYDINGIDLTTVLIQAAPSYVFTPAPVPFDMGAFGAPAVPAYADAIKHCEMAELQVFLDQAIDTGDPVNRRAFITTGGMPVYPFYEKKTEADFSGSIELLGKKPEILMHGSDRWIAGENLGSSGSLVPTGDIEQYKPDPALGS